MNPILTLYPAVSCLAQATAIQSLLAGCKARLFKAGFIPSFGTTLAEIVAQETNFSGYPAGGITITSFLDPVLAPGQGSAIMSPTVQFARDGTLPGVNDLVGGWFVVTSANVLWSCGTFPQAISFAVPGQGVPLIFSFGFPSG